MQSKVDDIINSTKLSLYEKIDALLSIRKSLTNEKLTIHWGD